MIIQSDSASISSSFVGQQFGLQADAALFQLLTSKVYSDPITAAMRELACNALDATIEALNVGQYEVHLPTDSELYFSVRDYGTGIPPELMHTLYSTMGASSKRESNDYTGALGIGKLAPLSYTSQFTIQSYLDDIMYSYLVTLDQGIPSLIGLGCTPTSEANGLYVQFQVAPSDISSFRSKAQSLFRFFSHKPKLNIDLDIHIPDSVFTSTEWFFANDYVPNYYSNYVLMSNILYRIDSSDIPELSQFRGLVIVCPTGSVSINPGREALSLDDPTKTYLAQRVQTLITEYSDTITNAIDAATTQVDKLYVAYTLLGTAPSAVAKAYKLLPSVAPDIKFWKSNTSDIYISDLPIFASGKRYYSYGRPKSFGDTALSVTVLKDLPIYVNDVTYPFANQLQGERIVLTRAKGFKVSEAASLITNWLDTIGAKYTLISEITTKPDKTPTAIREEGIYYAPFSASSVSSPTYQADPTVQYWYIPVNGTSHTLAIDYLEAIEAAHTLLDSAPQIVTIAKKYLEAVEASPNFTLATDVIQSELDKHQFLVQSAVDLPSNFRYRLDNPPPDIYQLYLYANSRPNFTSSHLTSPASKYFNLNIVYHYQPFSQADLDARYPLFTFLSRDYNSSPQFLSHYMELEHGKAPLITRQNADYYDQLRSSSQNSL